MSGNWIQDPGVACHSCMRHPRGTRWSEATQAIPALAGMITTERVSLGRGIDVASKRPPPGMARAARSADQLARRVARAQPEAPLVLAEA